MRSKYATYVLCSPPSIYKVASGRRIGPQTRFRSQQTTFGGNFEQPSSQERLKPDPGSRIKSSESTKSLETREGSLRRGRAEETRRLKMFGGKIQTNRNGLIVLKSLMFEI